MSEAFLPQNASNTTLEGIEGLRLLNKKDFGVPVKMSGGSYTMEYYCYINNAYTESSEITTMSVPVLVIYDKLYLTLSNAKIASNRGYNPPATLTRGISMAQYWNPNSGSSAGKRITATFTDIKDGNSRTEYFDGSFAFAALPFAIGYTRNPTALFQNIIDSYYINGTLNLYGRILEYAIDL